MLHGVKVTRSAPEVTHLFFADDSFLFFCANQAEASAVKHILTTYGCASGQLVNFTKSSISFSATRFVESWMLMLQMIIELIWDFHLILVRKRRLSLLIFETKSNRDCTAGTPKCYLELGKRSC